MEIKSVQVKDYYDVISEMMRGLHDSEREMFERTALWDDIKEGYMSHIIESQEEYSGTCLLAYQGEAPAGFIFGYSEEQDDSRIEEYTGEELYVSDGYIYPQYRRQGIYQELNKALEELYINKGIRRIVRFTLATNVRMQRFLEQEGYTTVRLLYEKWLSPEKQQLPLYLKPPKE